MIIIILVFVFTGGPGYCADALSHIRNHDDISEILNENYIFVSVDGTVQTKKSELLTVLNSDSYLSTLYDRYLEHQPPGFVPAITIQTIAQDSYLYINSHGDTSEIKDIYRQSTEDSSVDLVLLVTGRRFFGPFKVLIHIALTEIENDDFQWRACIYAYPEYTVCRFFIRNLHVIEKYFRKNTSDFVDLARDFLT